MRALLLGMLLCTASLTASAEEPASAPAAEEASAPSEAGNIDGAVNPPEIVAEVSPEESADGTSEASEPAVATEAPAPAQPALATQPAAPVPAQATVPAPVLTPKPEPAAEAKAEKKPGPASGEDSSTAAAASLLGPPSGIQWTFSWSLNAGLQTNPDFNPAIDPNASGDYTSANMGLQVGLNYKLHPKIFLAAALSPTLDLTASTSNNRRFDIQSTSVRLNFRNLYTESITGITLGANAGYQLPMANDLLYGNPRAGALSGALQFFRGVGPVTLIGSFGLNKQLFLNARAQADCDPELVAQKGASCPVDQNGEPLPVGGWNTSHTLSAGLTALWSTGNWSVMSSLSYALGNSYSPWDPNLVGNINANPNGNNRYSTSFFIQGAYSVTQAISVNAGIFNAGPVLTHRGSYNNPIFDPKFASVFLGVDVIK